ncbi:C4-dicarboxylate transport system [Thauera sp. 28]|uniref:TRAP transporter substrate-binding protein n=1 Tax=unclassified Thauera TaxID=2609274 RepID=UPI0002CF7234|nr:MULTISPECIES: TRAP transporter substrate-binding protein [unclassified Thauera]ENO75111.1 C4-dicarboxylate transport system [Thauera sp. 27]ENO91697.1 C4-dicarboxylate transport system [Thauera sp. 28]WBL64000.1 TRAP transporter substrate-binding protein [Thauera sp. WB-2]
MKNKIFGSLAAFGLSAGVLFGAPQAAASPEAFAGMKPATIKLAHVVNERDSFHLSAVRFKEIVEERSGGKLSVELFPNAVLGDERTLLEGMQMGTVDMGVITNGPVANFVEQMAVFELPFLFPTPEAAYKVLDGEIGQELLGRLERVNLKGLAYAERGFRNLTNSRRAVHGPADVQGMKIRVMENPVYIDTFRALGANAVPMAWTEALTAMQQGTIDGQENPVNVIHSFKLSETQKHMSLTRHTYAPAIFVMGLDRFKRLPEPAQALVKSAAQEAAEHGRRMNAEMQAAQLAELRAAGMQIDESPDVAAFQKAIESVYAKYESRFGDYLPRIRAALQ